ncbi:hypothetical protein [Legionella hackeliae]|uniref:Uncharacterized protein n=1 Tax=Legionella hackeliae TaxID=449 RepID=A0A0A8UN49_LEGHA|nr:hypothetical protein [Legionella hackeliae]KTD14067.1 hypothetical protein Lhac_0550 [Legionella hackeliae]CEK10138.1 exported protein of unknown function [Legionella hackeliae]STX46863.1 Uncharacterised protein [Legionella hackeliae]
MKKLLFCMMIASQVHAMTVLSERVWLTGPSPKGKSSIVSTNLSFSADVAKATTKLLDQFGYQGMAVGATATHSFYTYNGDGGSGIHTLRAKFCDKRNNCVNYEKRIQLKWKEWYGETIINQLTIFSDYIGREPLYAYTAVDGIPSAKDYKEGSLFLKPFPYD